VIPTVTFKSFLNIFREGFISIIGYGAPNVSGTNGVHGAPLGSDERKLTFEAYGV
jgi:hypothetical protein